MQGVLTVSKNLRCKVGDPLDVTFADEIREVAETKTTYIIDKLNLSPKHAAPQLVLRFMMGDNRNYFRI